MNRACCDRRFSVPMGTARIHPFRVGDQSACNHTQGATMRPVSHFGFQAKLREEAR